MRVIGGIYRSRSLHSLRGVALRPTSDRLRETLFNILGSAVEDSLFLDLFAGSGAVGIEALSRGARRAILVENHSAGVALLRRNLQSLGIAVESGAPRGASFAATKTDGFAGGAEILQQEALDALELLDRRGLRADFIFADPPYADTKAYLAVLEDLGDSELLAADGLAIFEHARRHALPAVSGRLERSRLVEQGDSSLSFFRMVRAA